MIGSSAYMFPMDHGNQKRPLVAWATGDPYEICVCSPPPLSLNIYFRTSNLVPEKDKISWPKIRTAKYYYWWQKKVIWYKTLSTSTLDFRNFNFVLQLVRSQKETSFYVLKHFFLINFGHHHKFIHSIGAGNLVPRRTGGSAEKSLGERLRVPLRLDVNITCIYAGGHSETSQNF